MTPIRAWTGPSKAALAAAVAALALCGGAAVGTVRLDPLPQTADTRGALTMPGVPPRGTGIADSLILVALTKDPFRPDRQRPSERYRMPGERDPSAAAPSALGSLRLLGTAALPRGAGVAAFQAPGQPPRVVRVGQSVQGFKLKKVDRGIAVLQGPDSSIVLRLEPLVPESQKP